MAVTNTVLTSTKECVGCHRDIYINKGQPAICGDCGICPKCGSQVEFRCSVEHNIFECEWCEHKFSSLHDLEEGIKEYWIARAKTILGFL